MKIGLFFGVFFSLIATVPLAIGAVSGEPVGRLLWVYPFYLLFGAAGGAIVGVTRALHQHYLGRLLTAAVVVYLVYGGCAVFIYYFMPDEMEGVSLSTMLKLWIPLAIIIAPFYEKMMRGFDSDVAASGAA